MIKIPENLIQYVDFEEGKIVSINLPKELEDDFNRLKELFNSMKNDELTEY